MQLNPLLKRDMKALSGGTAFPLFLICSAAVLSIVSLLGVSARINVMKLSGNLDRGGFLEVYFIAVCVLLAGVLLTAPHRTAGFLVQERNSGSLDLMFSAGLSPVRIVGGRLLSAFVTACVLLFACFPALLIPLLYGGVDFQSVLFLLVLFVPLLLLLLCLGLFTGAAASSAGLSGILCFGILFALFLIPAGLTVLFVMNGENRASALLALCPASPVISVLASQTGGRIISDSLLLRFGFSGVEAFQKQMLLPGILWEIFASLVLFFASVQRIGRNLSACKTTVL